MHISLLLWFLHLLLLLIFILYLFSVPPSISGNHEMVTVVVNNPVRLECEARGIPVPILTWLKDGSPVSSFSNGLQVLLCERLLVVKPVYLM